MNGRKIVMVIDQFSIFRVHIFFNLIKLIAKQTSPELLQRSMYIETHNNRMKRS